MKKNTKRILVFAGTAIMGTAYVPDPKPAPTREFIARTYIRATPEQRRNASETRKREILAKLDAISKVIKNKAESYQMDRNTRLTGITANQKLIIHTTKLMENIARYKNS